MKRRQQKLSRSKQKTAWLAWAAWGVVGSVFLFEDIEGGSGYFSFLLTSPFWLMFAVWPFLWLWLKSRRDPALVEIDDDITAAGKTARLVQKEGVRYVESAPFSAVFGVKARGTVKLAGGDEDFTRLEDVRALARGRSEDDPLVVWIATVDGIASP